MVQNRPAPKPGATGRAFDHRQGWRWIAGGLRGGCRPFAGRRRRRLTAAAPPDGKARWTERAGSSNLIADFQCTTDTPTVSRACRLEAGCGLDSARARGLVRLVLARIEQSLAPLPKRGKPAGWELAPVRLARSAANRQTPGRRAEGWSWRGGRGGVYPGDVSKPSGQVEVAKWLRASWGPKEPLGASQSLHSSAELGKDRRAVRDRLYGQKPLRQC